jgi:glycosyltransferase involved in cell wall biosynthesis
MSISIVTPCLNQAQFVEETIKSVLDQGYPRLEYVVVDGGSSDGSVDIIEKYRSKLHSFVSEPDRGHADALNKGFGRTSGEIMAWLNGDDKYVPWTLQTVSEVFEQFPDVNWIVGINSWWNDRGAMIYTAVTLNNIFDYLSGKYFGIQQESVFWRRRLWERAGGYVSEECRLMPDTELWTRFYPLDDLWHVSCVLGGFRVHPENRGAKYHSDALAERNRAIEAMRGKLDPTALERMERGYRVLNYDRSRSTWAKHLVPRKPGA